MSDQSKDDRITLLQAYVREEPNDPFNRYALALEWIRLGHNMEAIEQFEMLRQYHASYLPTYYQLGKVLESLNRIEEAILVYTEGIEVALKQGASKTASELRSALDFLE
ncbi:MAG: tetratricopeptide repeat protein [Bacteroidota bacterium]|jgi:tetratricopeptide (TPR) repeat protein